MLHYCVQRPRCLRDYGHYHNDCSLDTLKRRLQLSGAGLETKQGIDTVA